MSAIQRPSVSRSNSTCRLNAAGRFVLAFGRLACILTPLSRIPRSRCHNAPRHLMSTRVLMNVEEYLRTSFEGSDCEYLDGEVVERNMGELPHADVQGNLLS